MGVSSYGEGQRMVLFCILLVGSILSLGCESELPNEDEEALSDTFSHYQSPLTILDTEGCCYTANNTECSDSACSFCVCKEDPFCCESQWDTHCVARASAGCLEDCGCTSGCSTPPGDVNESNATNVLDVQCAMLAVLGSLSGNEIAPDCTLGDYTAADINCDQSITITDTQILILLSLDTELPLAIDANQDQCPDACEYSAQALCEGAADGSWCDDGDRCTNGDTCVEEVCVGGLPPDCDDGNVCTTDLCNTELGCRHFANNESCAAGSGQGVCADKLCSISVCENYTWDLNKIGADGCEYNCLPVPSVLEVCINNKDDDCNGAIDEGCFGECDETETADDGYDSDCDGTELLMDTNALGYQGKLPVTGTTFSLPVMGLFDFGPFGSLGSEGTMTRSSSDGPVSWCVFGNRPDRDFGTVLLIDILLEVCRSEAGIVSPTYDATVEWEGESRPASGSFNLPSPWSVGIGMEDISLTPTLLFESVTLTVLEGSQTTALSGDLRIGSGGTALHGVVNGEYAAFGNLSLPFVMAPGNTWSPFTELPLVLTEVSGALTRTNGVWDVEINGATDALTVAPNLALTQVVISAETPSTKGDWSLLLEGTSTLGPFENVSLLGEITSDDESGEALGCFSGIGETTLNDIAMTEVQLEPCVNTGATLSTALTGFMEIEGTNLAFAGYLSLGAAWYLTTTVVHLPLADGIVLNNALFIFQEAGNTIPLVGQISLGAGDALATFTADGNYDANNDFSLDLTLANNTQWKAIPGLAMQVLAVSGSIERVGQSTSLHLVSTSTDPSETIEVSNSFLVENPVVKAVVSTDGETVISLDGDATLGPFGTQAVSGVADEDGTLCFEASSSLDSPLAVLTNTELETCIDPQGNVSTTLDTDAFIAGTNLSCSGAANLEDPWVIQLDVPSWDMGDGFLLDDVHFSLVEGAQKLKINGGFDVESEGSIAEVRAAGFFEPNTPFSLPLSLENEEVWTPFSALELEVSEILGNLKKVNGIVSFSFVSTNSMDVDLGAGLTMVAAVVLAESILGGGVKVTLVGDVDLGPLGEVEVEGIPGTNEAGVSVGCFTEVTALGLGSIIVQDALLQICLEPDGTTTVTFEGDSLIDGAIRPLSGVLELEPFKAILDLGEHELGPGIIMEGVTLVYVEGSAFLELTGITTLGDSASGLTVNLTGLFKNHGNAYLTPSIPPQTTWKPITSLDLELNQVVGLVERIGGVSSAEVIGEDSDELIVTPGLTLATPTVTGVVTETGEWLVKLNGSSSLPVGEDTLTVLLKEADIYDTEIFVFEGTETDLLSPLPSLVGADHFYLLGADVTVSVIPGGIASISLAADSKFCISTAPCTIASMADATLAGTLELSGDFSLQGDTEEVEIAQFDEMDEGVLFATTTSLPTSTLIPGVVLPLSPGVTFVAEATSPHPLTADEDQIPFVFEFLEPGKILVLGIHEDPWYAVGPAVIESIESVVFSDVTFEGTLMGTNLAIDLFGVSTVQPLNQPNALQTSAPIKLAISGAAKNNFWTNEVHQGSWHGAFLLESAGLYNPKLYLRFQKSAGIPVVHQITTQAVAYWKRPTALWPPAGEALQGAPGIVKGTGQMAIFRADYTTLLCGLFVCPKAIQFRSRLQVTDLTLLEAHSLMEDGRNMAIDAGFADYVPASPLGVPDVSPLDLSVQVMTLQFSNVATNQNGIQWNPGLYVDLETEIGSSIGSLSGRMGLDGIQLTGGSDAFLLGDTPFSETSHRLEGNVANGGAIQWDDLAALDTTELTVEAWVYTPAWNSGTLSHPVFEKLSGDNGFRIGFGKPAGTKAKIRVELVSNGATRWTESTAALARAGSWEHLAVTFSGTKAAIFLNGKRLQAKAGGAGAGAGENTVDHVIGEGVDAIDNIRIWDSLRDEDAIAAERVYLDASPVAHFTLESSESAPEVENLGTGSNATLIGGASVGPSTTEFESDWRLDIPVATTGHILKFNGSMDWLLPVVEAPTDAFVDSTLEGGTTTGLTRLESLVLMELTQIGALGLTGSGMDGIEGTNDDELVVAANSLAFELDGMGTWNFTNNAGVTDTAGEAEGTAVSYSCPTSDSCPLPPYGHVFDATGTLSLSSELPGALGPLALIGETTFDSGLSTLTTSGSLEVFDQSLSSPLILSESDETTLVSSLDLSPIVGFPFTSVELPLTFDHEALTLCGDGVADSDVDGLEGTLNATVEACVGSTLELDYVASGDQVTLLDRDFFSPVLYGGVNGMTLAGLTYIPGIFTGYLIGNYGGLTDFLLSATTTMTVKGFKLYGALISFAPSGLGVEGNLVAGIAGVFAMQGPFVDNVPALNGTGEMNIADLLIDSTLAIADTLVTTATLDVPPLDIDLTGTLATPGNLELSGGASATFITTAGGWYFPLVEVSLLSCVKSTGVCAGVDAPYEIAEAQMDVDIPGSFAVMKAPLGITPLEFSADHDGTFGSQTLLNSLWTFSLASGLVITGDVPMPTGPVAVSGTVPPVGAYTLSAGEETPLLNNPPMTGLVTLAVDLLGNASVGGPLSLIFEGEALLDATWDLSENDAFSFSGVRSDSGVYGERCAEDPSTKQCETCSTEICDYECTSPFGTYCCLSHTETSECNCTIDDYCADLGSIVCNVIVAGDSDGYDAEFDAICTQNGSPPFQAAVPRTTGNICIYGGTLLGNQCVTLW